MLVKPIYEDNEPAKGHFTILAVCIRLCFKSVAEAGADLGGGKRLFHGVCLSYFLTFIFKTAH
jgi:hypothetical protein